MPLKLDSRLTSLEVLAFSEQAFEWRWADSDSFLVDEFPVFNFQFIGLESECRKHRQEDLSATNLVIGLCTVPITIYKACSKV